MNGKDKETLGGGEIILKSMYKKGKKMTTMI